MTQKRDLGKTLDDLSPVEYFHWATYLPNREGGRYQFKRHQTLGHAKLAVNYVNGSNATGAEIYNYIDDQWVLVFEVDENRNLKEVHA